MQEIYTVIRESCVTLKVLNVKGNTVSYQVDRNPNLQTATIEEFLLMTNG